MNCDDSSRSSLQVLSGRCVHYKVRKYQLLVGRKDMIVTYPRSQFVRSQTEVGVAGAEG
jgi:hypothetical protein